MDATTPATAVADPRATTYAATRRWSWSRRGRVDGKVRCRESLDRLFLAAAPQIAGRDGEAERPVLVAGKRLAPDDPRWAMLVGLKRAGSHFFARHALAAER
jgi:hypothetical protein